MAEVIAQGWCYMPHSKKRHYFIVTDDKPQIVDSLCRTFSTSPHIATRLSEGPFKMDAGCKACQRKLDSLNKKKGGQDAA